MDEDPEALQLVGDNNRPRVGEAVPVLSVAINIITVLLSVVSVLRLASKYRSGINSVKSSYLNSDNSLSKLHVKSLRQIDLTT